MKEISPLSNIEKNGLFGNYQNKGEDKIIIINEVSNIKVYQLVKFKSCSLESTSISIDDQILPISPNSVNGNKVTRILWHAPNTWLIISSDRDISKKITDNCS